MRAKLEALLYELVDRAGWSVDVASALDEYEEHIISKLKEQYRLNELKIYRYEYVDGPAFDNNEPPFEHNRLMSVCSYPIPDGVGGFIGCATYTFLRIDDVSGNYLLEYSPLSLEEE